MQPSLQYVLTVCFALCTTVNGTMFCTIWGRLREQTLAWRFAASGARAAHKHVEMHGGTITVHVRLGHAGLPPVVQTLDSRHAVVIYANAWADEVSAHKLKHRQFANASSDKAASDCSCINYYCQSSCWGTDWAIQEGLWSKFASDCACWESIATQNMTQ